MGRKVPTYPPTRQFRPDGTPNPNYRPGAVKPDPPPAPPPAPLPEIVVHCKMPKCKPRFPPIVEYTKGKGLP